MAGKSASADKTNVMRVLESRHTVYTAHSYDADPTMTGAQIAAILGEPAAFVFKTLVTKGKSGKNYVFVIPVESALDLKKAAKAVGEKSIEMIHQKDLLPLTGYVHGGCSPIGMKKAFPTNFISEYSPREYADIYTEIKISSHLYKFFHNKNFREA